MKKGAASIAVVVVVHIQMTIRLQVAVAAVVAVADYRKDFPQEEAAVGTAGNHLHHRMGSGFPMLKQRAILHQSRPQTSTIWWTLSFRWKRFPRKLMNLLIKWWQSCDFLQEYPWTRLAISVIYCEDNLKICLLLWWFYHQHMLYRFGPVES